jgi:predicted acylesterase/phospholipase RssA
VNAAEFLDEYRPFRRGELALVRKLDDDPYFLPPPEADALRYALRLAQLSSTGREPGDLEGRIGYFRLRLLQLLAPVLPTDPDRLQSAALAAVLPRVVRFVAEARARVIESGTASAEQLDREVGTKRLALVLGGAGGSGYIYLGALARLAELGIEPAYMVGCSIGSLLAIVRARRRDFELGELLEEISRLRARALFRAPSPLVRFGLPAALRLDLRPAIGDVFTDPDGVELRLRDLAIPVDTLATGVGRGALSRPKKEFAALVEPGPARLTDIDASALGRAVTALVALAMSRSVVAPVVLGADPDTAALPALDAAGFSAAIPALLHYDVPREATRSIAILDRLFEARDLVALVDGVLVSTLPARHAWESIEAGRIGTRNCAIVALDALVPQRGAHALLDPIQRVVAATAHRDKPFWDLRVAYRRVPGMLELFPAPRLLRAAITNGEREFEPTARLLRGLLAPLPPWETLRERVDS